MLWEILHDKPGSILRCIQQLAPKRLVEAVSEPRQATVLKMFMLDLGQLYSVFSLIENFQMGFLKFFVNEVFFKKMMNLEFLQLLPCFPQIMKNIILK